MFHNRLTHSLKVAQVGRRLAESLLRKYPSSEVVTKSLDPDVVEAAALAHDLGHPPFGHIADHALCQLAEREGLADGFEGNAQTFRIVTRLAVRRDDAGLGLDLTRATLAAVAKYPWPRASSRTPQPYRRKKFSFYADDKEAAEFAMQGLPKGEKSLECQVMDLADAITYSVHDLEDFFRAGLIPVERLMRDRAYRNQFLERWKQAEPDSAAMKHAQHESSWFNGFNNLLGYLSADAYEPGSRKEVDYMDRFRSVAITSFISSVEVDLSGKGGALPTLKGPDTSRYLMKFLQRLVWDYVILTPRLSTQQAGQIHLITALFEYFLDSLRESRPDRLPTKFRDAAADLKGPKRGPGAKALDRQRARLAIDMVASLTEAQAVVLHKRVAGFESGSVLDLLG